MNILTYIRKRNELIHHIEKMDVVTDNNLLSHLTLTSANYRKFMPWLPFDHHLDYFKHIVLHQQLSALEQKYPDALAFLSVEGLSQESSRLLHEKPSIICTFHSGSYRLLNTFLMDRQIPYALVASGTILQKQKDSYQQTFDRLHRSYLYHNFTLIEAESPSSALQMLRALKEGKSLLIYIDGNTGVQPDHSKSHLANFLEGKIFTKSGVPVIAHIAGVPIINAISYRKSIDEPVLRFFDPIFPFANRQTFSELALQQIYDNFSSLLKQYPDQWEAWMYLHRSLPPAKDRNTSFIPTDQLLAFVLTDKERFGLINTEKNRLLFDKDSYLSYPVDEFLYLDLFRTLFKST